MNEVRPFLEAYIDLNIALIFALLVWVGLRAVLRVSPLASAYQMQLRLLTVHFLCVLISPLLAWGVGAVAHQVWPHQSLAVSDIAVAAFLRGDIAMPALAFEELLNTRQRWMDQMLGGASMTSVLIGAAFAIGVAAFLYRVVRAAMLVRRTIRKSFVWRQSARVDIRVSDHVNAPFAVRGLRRRHVVLPSGLITSPRRVRFVLAHEFQHLRSGDTEWELFFELLRPLFFWNPAIILWKQQFDRLRELGCDQAVVARHGTDIEDYTKCLLDVCAGAVGKTPPRVMNVAFVRTGRAKRALLRRIEALHAKPARPTAKATRLLPALALASAGVIALGTASIRQTQDWSQDRLMLSTVVNLERLEQINRGF